MKMKTRLLTALVAAGCFSQMAVAGSTLLTGSVSDLTTATATVELTQPTSLENTLTPVEGLKAGATISSIASGVIARGNLKIREAGVTQNLAIKSEMSGYSHTPFETYATGHDGDDDYKLQYRAMPNDKDYDSFMTSDGNYLISKRTVNTWDYVVYCNSDKLPKAGNYVITLTGAVYNS